MATITQIRDGLAVRLATITGLHPYAVHPASVIVPAAIVRAVGEDYHQAMGGNGGHSVVRCEVKIVVSVAAGWDLASVALDPYLSRTGTDSIRAAIEADKTLGGIVDTLTVQGWQDYDDDVINDETFLIATVLVEVFNNV